MRPIVPQALPLDDPASGNYLGRDGRTPSVPVPNLTTE